MVWDKSLVRVGTVAISEAVISTGVGMPQPVMRALVAGGSFAASQALPLERISFLRENKQLSDIVVGATISTLTMPLVVGDTQSFTARFLYELAAMAAGVYGADLFYGVAAAAESREIVIS